MERNYVRITLLGLLLCLSVIPRPADGAIVGGTQAVCTTENRLRCWDRQGQLPLVPDTKGELSDGALISSENAFCAQDTHGVHCWREDYPEVEFHPELAKAVDLQMSDWLVCGKVDGKPVCYANDFDKKSGARPFPLHFFDASKVSRLFPMRDALCATFPSKETVNDNGWPKDVKVDSLTCNSGLKEDLSDPKDLLVAKPMENLEGKILLSYSQWGSTYWTQGDSTYREDMERLTGKKHYYSVRRLSRDTFTLPMVVGWGSRLCYVAERLVNPHTEFKVYYRHSQGSTISDTNPTLQLGGFRPFVECNSPAVSAAPRSKPAQYTYYPWRDAYLYPETSFRRLIPLRGHLCAEGSTGRLYCASARASFVMEDSGLSDGPWGGIEDSVCRPGEGEAPPVCFTLSEASGSAGSQWMPSVKLHSSLEFSLTSKSQLAFATRRIADALYPWKRAPLDALADAIESLGSGYPNARPSVLKNRRWLVEAVGRFIEKHSADHFKTRLVPAWRAFAASNELESAEPGLEGVATRVLAAALGAMARNPQGRDSVSLREEAALLGGESGSLDSKRAARIRSLVAVNREANTADLVAIADYMLSYLTR